MKVVLTRDEGLADAVRALGAEVAVVPLVRYEAVPAEADPARYDWIVFTSARAVAYSSFPLDAGPKVACVGPATARAVEERGGRVHYVPERHDAEALAEGLAETARMAGARVLFPCSEKALGTVEEVLSAAGAEVKRLVTYRGRPATELPADALRGADVLVFLAPSAVEAFAALGGDLRASPVLVIGPTTAAAVRARGVEPVTAPRSDRDGLLEAIRSWDRR